MEHPHHVVIVGGGFGGLYAACQSLRLSSGAGSLIDRRNFHLFQPLLYQVATGGALRLEYHGGRSAMVCSETAEEHAGADGRGLRFDLRQRHGADGRRRRLRRTRRRRRFENSFFGRADWERRARREDRGRRDRDRRRILMAAEVAERETDPRKIREWLTFVVVGGGPTGRTRRRLWRKSAATRCAARVPLDQSPACADSLVGRAGAALALLSGRTLREGEGPSWNKSP